MRKISFTRFNEVWRSYTDCSEAEEWSTSLPVDPLYLTFQSLTATLRTVPPALKFKNSTWCSLCVECFVRISEQTATFALYIINRLVFITVVESAYSAVRTDSLYKADYVSFLEGFLEG